MNDDIRSDDNVSSVEAAPTPSTARGQDEDARPSETDAKSRGDASKGVFDEHVSREDASDQQDQQRSSEPDDHGKTSGADVQQGRRRPSAQQQDRSGGAVAEARQEGQGSRGGHGGKQSRQNKQGKQGKQDVQNRGGSGRNGSPSDHQQHKQGGQHKNHRRQRRNREPVAPQVTREELEALRVVDLREKAAEIGLDTKPLKRKGEIVDALYEAMAKAEGFVEVEGILDILSEGYGFLRTEGYLAGENDIYVGQNTIRRNALRPGDYITGQCRPARDNEKYPALHRIDRVNGKTPEEASKRVRFRDLTPVYPSERLVMEHGKNTITARTIDLVAPIGKGQRGLIVSPPKAGKTTILKDIAASITANNPEVHLMCLLVDERPEEVTDMQRSIRGEVISSTFDMPSENHIAVSELAIERAKRLVEEGEDVVILLDSITRLARAYNLAQPASGRILSGGVDSTALYPPKRFLGAARNIENGGSLTILASALVDTGSKMDEVIFEEFKGTGNMELKLDRDLADRRIFPAIDPVASGTRKEELLIDPQEAPFIWGVRRVLANLNNTERAMTMLIKSLKQTDDNQDFLVRTARKARERSSMSLEL
ncbi:MAG: transcription termination factor Rho [Coriobacteriales bacterium]